MLCLDASDYPIDGVGTRIQQLRKDARRNLKRGYKAVGSLFR